MPLVLNVDPRSGYPVYLQIVEQIRRAVAVGILAPGEHLPTVKEIAGKLVVNPATVSRALRELEHLAIVESFPGRGAFVRSDAAPAASASAASEVVRERIDAAVREARSLGVDDAAVRDLFSDAMHTWYSENGKAALRDST